MDLYTIRNTLNLGKSIYDLQLRVTYYTRVSTSTLDQLNSLKNQINYFEEHIKSCNNWTLVEGYIDEGITGTSINKREAFNQMIEDGRNKKFDLVITKEVSRFARNTIDSLFYTRELLKYGIGVLFQNDGINTLMPDSEVKLAIMSSLAQEESRKISDRVKWGHKRSIDSGKVLGNNKIWGYNKENGKLVIEKEEAEIVCQIFDLYANQNKGIRTVSDMLSQKEIVNRNGNPITFNTIKSIITNPKYKGYYCGKKSTTIDFITKEREFFNSDKWITYKDYESVPPIVSEEIWEKANNILKQRSEKMTSEDKTSYQNKFLYSGKIICSEHKTSYWRNFYKYDTIESKEVWQCKIYRKKGKKFCDSPMMYKNELDDIMKHVLHMYSKYKNVFSKELTELHSKYLKEVNYDKDIKELMNNINENKVLKKNLLRLYAGGNVADNDYQEQIKDLNDEIEGYEKRIKNYEKLNDAKYDVASQVKSLKEFFNFDFDINSELDEETMDKFLEKIEVSKGKEKNEICINVVLKAGLGEIPVYFIRDMHLMFITHIEDNKRMFKFFRKKNARDTHPVEVNYIIDLQFELAS